MTIKENVLRKNLITKEIDRGRVDSEFELSNLAGKIIPDFPHVEISENDEEYKAQFFSKEKAKKLNCIKQEANFRIIARFPEYKQRNLIAAVCLIHNKEIMSQKLGTIYELLDAEKETIKKASECNDFILLIREKSNTLEALVSACVNIEELNDIDISKDNFWI